MMTEFDLKVYIGEQPMDAVVPAGEPPAVLQHALLDERNLLGLLRPRNCVQQAAQRPHTELLLLKEDHNPRPSSQTD